MNYSKKFKAVQLLVIDKFQASAEHLSILGNEFDPPCSRKLRFFADENNIIIKINKAFFDVTRVFRQNMDNYISAKCRIFRTGSAGSSFNSNPSSIGRDITFKTAPKNIHIRLFNFPFVSFFVQEFFEPKFSVNLPFLVQVYVFGLLDSTNPNPANHPNFTVKLAYLALGGSVGKFCSPLPNVNLRCFAYPAVEQIHYKHSGKRNKPYIEFSRLKAHFIKV